MQSQQNLLGRMSRKMTFQERRDAKTAADIDGTLLDYGHVWSPVGEPDVPSIVNIALCEQLRGQDIHLITNQGGIPLALFGVPKLPRPEQFAARINFLVRELANYEVRVASLRVSVWHAKASVMFIEDAARQTNAAFRLPQLFLVVAYTEEHYRKPSPSMLWFADVNRYYGDSDDDEKAAIAQGAEFVRVPRFTGEGG